MSTRVALGVALSVTGLAYGQTAVTPPRAGGVYVAPFRVPDTTEQPFVGEAVRDAVTAQLAREKVDVKSSAGRPASADAVAAARAAGAQYVLTGSVQTADGRFRIDGQLVDVDHPQAVVAGLTTTGTDRLAGEDEIAAQATRAVRRATMPASPSGEPSLRAADLLAVVSPPVPAGKDYYPGSRLEQSLNTNRTPANDYAQQLYNSRVNNTFGSYSNYGYPLYGGFGFGFGGFGYGFGSGYGGFGGGFGGGFAAPYGNFIIHGGAGLR